MKITIGGKELDLPEHVVEELEEKYGETTYRLGQVIEVSGEPYIISKCNLAAHGQDNHLTLTCLSNGNCWSVCTPLRACTDIPYETLAKCMGFSPFKPKKVWNSPLEYYKARGLA